MRRHVTKIAQNGNTLWVAVPRTLLAEMGLQKGDHVGVTRVGDALVIMPIEKILQRQVADVVDAAPVALREVFAR